MNRGAVRGKCGEVRDNFGEVLGECGGVQDTVGALASTVRPEMIFSINQFHQPARKVEN